MAKGGEIAPWHCVFGGSSRQPTKNFCSMSRSKKKRGNGRPGKMRALSGVCFFFSHATPMSHTVQDF